MALSRRVGFTTLAGDQPQPVDHPRTHAVRKTPESRPDRPADTVRLALTLFESDDVSYPEFSYGQCVQQVPWSPPWSLLWPLGTWSTVPAG